MMDVDEAMEPAVDDISGAANAEVLDVSCAHKSAANEMQREMDELFKYYKEVSGHQLNPEELPCSRNDSLVACLLEESSLPYAKLIDQIFERLKLQDGVTESSVRSLVLNVGKRFSYGICTMNVDELEDESESSLWCWETQDLELLPSHLRDFLSIRRTARKLIHERIMVLIGKLPAKDPHKAHGNQKIQSVNVGEVLNLDGIRSFIEKLHQKNDAEITNAQCKTMVQESEATRIAVKDEQKIVHQVQKEQKRKDRELKHLKGKSEKEEKHIERENKRLKKNQKEVEREKKRWEKEQAELKQQSSIQRQANLMEQFLKRKTIYKMENSGGHHSVKTTCSMSSENTGELAVVATSTMDCMLSQANCLGVDEVWLAHVARWRKLAQNNRFCHWGVRRSPKIQLFNELKLHKPSKSAPSDEIMSTSTKEQSFEENPGSLFLSTQLDELRKPCCGNEILCKATNKCSSSTLLFMKKLLQFDGSHRPSFYGIWRKESSTVSGRHPLKRDPELNYEVDSDEEWEEEDPGERLPDFEKDDEEVMNEDDSKIDAEEETVNSFVLPSDYLSEDEGVQSGKFDDTCSMLSTSGITAEELNVLQQSEKALNCFTEHALRKDMPLVISNLDHRKVDLLKAEDVTGILKVEKLCLQALCMRTYPGGPVIDVPIDVNVSFDVHKFCRANKSTPVASKSISDIDMPQFVKLITSYSHGMNKLVDLLLGTFPCVSKAQLKKKVREIAEFTHNRWQVKNDILDRYGLSLSPDTRGSVKQTTPYFSQRCPSPDESGKSGDFSRAHSEI